VIWLVFAGIALILVYEIWAAITLKAPTISQYVWRGSRETWAVPFLGGLGFGLLAGHFWL
jgi:hypothetical protein